MKFYQTILCISCLFYLHGTLCFEPISTIVIAGTGAYLGYQAVKCTFKECCNDQYILHDTSNLSSKLKLELFGQDLAIHPIVGALRGHFATKKSQKALAMAFHGPPGTGKNFVAAMIRDTFYKEGISSKYYNFFNGRVDFPLESEVGKYKVQIREMIRGMQIFWNIITYCNVSDFYPKERLKKTIVDALIDCPRSLFVFDEVDDMAEGVLDVLVPFLDYGPTQVRIDSTNQVVETREAVFIFLSNTGSQRIIERLMELWNEGKSRETSSLADFESLIAMGAFNEKGGFHKSDTISTSLIDHYVPFLPLEHEHVKLCIKAAFIAYDIYSPTDNQIEEVMSYVTFGPDHFNLYAKSGCKRLEQKVASIAYRRRSKNEL